MLKTILLIISVLALARAQIPSLGWCPEYVPMANFDISKFMGNWYEVERSLQLPELGSRCAMVSYTKGADNKLHVSNIISRFLGFQRVIEGEIILPSTKAEEGKLNLRYTTSLSNLPTNYHILETDYKRYAVLWNCNSLGPVRTENLWIMTRDRLPSSETLQKAYAVLDKYKISKSYLITSDQTDCKYTGVDNILTPSLEEEEPEAPVEEASENFRSAIIADDSEVNKEEKQEIANPEAIKAEPIKEEPIALVNIKNEKEKSSLPSTVAEVILINSESPNEKIKEEIKKIKVEVPAASTLPKIAPIVAPAAAAAAAAAAAPIKKPVAALKVELQQEEKKKS